MLTSWSVEVISQAEKENMGKPKSLWFRDFAKFSILTKCSINRMPKSWISCQLKTTGKYSRHHVLKEQFLYYVTESDKVMGEECKYGDSLFHWAVYQVMLKVWRIMCPIHKRKDITSCSNNKLSRCRVPFIRD